LDKKYDELSKNSVHRILFVLVKGKKCVWWMPWILVPKKDVLSCVKPREAAVKRYYSGMSEWGNSIKSNLRLPITESRASGHRWFGGNSANWNNL